MVKLNIINDTIRQLPFVESEPFIEVTDEEFGKIQNGELKLINGVLTNVSKQIETQNQIENLTQKLDKTDYIANKLAEAVSKYISTGDNTGVLLLREKYALELANREEWRKEIDSLKEKLKNL